MTAPSPGLHDDLPDPLQGRRDALIAATLPHIAFDGWSLAALRAGARDLDWDTSWAERAFMNGPHQAVLHFIALADRQMAEQAEQAGLEALKVSERIRWLVRTRLENWAPHREAIRRAVTLLSLPAHAAAAVKATWATVDEMWWLAGDRAVDFSYYSKRATLAAVYSATLLVWLDDRSDDFADSWAFLDRRLADVTRLPRLKKSVQAVTSRIPGLDLLTGRSGKGLAGKFTA